MLLDKLDPCQRAWVEVKPAAIEANTRNIKQRLPKQCILMAVVKADGYGHGAQTVAKSALEGGAQSLGVATLQEGIDLRQAGIKSPILLLGNLTNEEDLDACLSWNLMPTISDYREAVICHKIAEERVQTFAVHVKVDTGMTRLGCELSDAPSLLNFIDDLRFLDLEGVYSHLALADGDFDGEGGRVTFHQKQKFDNLLKSISLKNKSIVRHLANSAGTLRDCGLYYDMVRVGIALYGYSPIESVKNDFSLEPALAVKARITLIREVPAGTGVSYGHTFITKEQSRLAVVGIGYADGVGRALSGKISVLINGKLFPQVGAITMDQLVIDITGNLDISVGNVVTLLGFDQGRSLSPYYWSDISGSIPWEILCGFKYRLPRVIV